MSISRQARSSAATRSPAAVTTFVRDYESGDEVPRHAHGRDQLVYASKGVMTIRTDAGAWVTPPQRAVWIPAGVAHRIAMSGTVSMRTLYFRRRLVRGLPRACCVVKVSGLLRELILHACAQRALGGRRRAERHLIGMLSDQVRAFPALPLELPMPTEPRARRVAERLAAGPGAREPLSRICREAGAGRRTAERVFIAETGLSLGKWRQQLRLMHALRLLGGGVPIAQVALDAGYSSASAFTFAFRNALGATPSGYFVTPS
jgi:AraC-like DNA-binding protein